MRRHKIKQKAPPAKPEALLLTLHKKGRHKPTLRARTEGLPVLPLWNKDADTLRPPRFP